MFGLLCLTSTSRTAASSPAVRKTCGVSGSRANLCAGPRWRPNRRVEWNAPLGVSSARRMCPSRAHETICISPHKGKNLAYCPTENFNANSYQTSNRIKSRSLEFFEESSTIDFFLANIFDF